MISHLKTTSLPMTVKIVLVSPSPFGNLAAHQPLQWNHCLVLSCLVLSCHAVSWRGVSCSVVSCVLSMQQHYRRKKKDRYSRTHTPKTCSNLLRMSFTWPLSTNSLSAPSGKTRGADMIFWYIFRLFSS